MERQRGLRRLSTSSNSKSRSRSGSPVITSNSTLESYKERSTQFQVDDGPRRSAFKEPEARSLKLERAVPYSAPVVELRPDGKIVQLESSLSDCGIIGTIRSVNYGTWEGRPACLIAMRFFFRFSESNRFKSTEILVTFDSPSKTDRKYGPIVRNFSPRKVYGQKNQENKSWHYDVGVEAALPSGPASITPNISGGKESSFTREHHLEVIGKPWSSKDHLDFNQVVWTAHETKTQKHGIPDELNLAMVVEHDGPFQAFVELEGKVAHNITLRAWPWDKRRPLLFDGVTSVGSKPPFTTEFEKLTATQWRELAPYTGEYEDVVALEKDRAQLDQGVVHPAHPTEGLGITSSD